MFKFPLLLTIASLYIIAFSSNAQCPNKDLIDPDQICDNNYDPVCGCDNITYTNGCIADRNGILEFTKGVCETTYPYNFKWTKFTDNTKSQGDMSQWTKVDLNQQTGILTVELNTYVNCMDYIEEYRYAVTDSNDIFIDIKWNRGVSNPDGLHCDAFHYEYIKQEIILPEQGTYYIELPNADTLITWKKYEIAIDANGTCDAERPYIPFPEFESVKYIEDSVFFTVLIPTDCCNSDVLSAYKVGNNAIKVDHLLTTKRCLEECYCIKEFEFAIEVKDQDSITIIIPETDTTVSRTCDIPTIKNTYCKGEKLVIPESTSITVFDLMGKEISDFPSAPVGLYTIKLEKTCEYDHSTITNNTKAIVEQCLIKQDTSFTVAFTNLCNELDQEAPKESIDFYTHANRFKFNMNQTLNCCSNEIAQIEVFGDSIVLSIIDTSATEYEACDCNCVHNMSFTLYDADKKNYSVYMNGEKLKPTCIYTNPDSIPNAGCATKLLSLPKEMDVVLYNMWGNLIDKSEYNNLNQTSYTVKLTETCKTDTSFSRSYWQNFFALGCTTEADTTEQNIQTSDTSFSVSFTNLCNELDQEAPKESIDFYSQANRFKFEMNHVLNCCSYEVAHIEIFGDSIALSIIDTSSIGYEACNCNCVHNMSFTLYDANEKNYSVYMNGKKIEPTCNYNATEIITNSICNTDILSLPERINLSLYDNWGNKIEDDSYSSIQTDVYIAQIEETCIHDDQLSRLTNTNLYVMNCSQNDTIVPDTTNQDSIVQDTSITPLDITTSSNNLVTLSPTPAKDYLQIESTKDLKTIQIVASTGVIVNIEDVVFNRSKNTLNIQNLKKGLYILTIYFTDGRVVSERFVKE